MEGMIYCEKCKSYHSDAPDFHERDTKAAVAGLYKGNMPVDKIAMLIDCSIDEVNRILELQEGK